MFELESLGDVIVILVEAEFSRAEFIVACQQAQTCPDVRGIPFDMRQMTNAPGRGRGPFLAGELPLLFPGRRIAFVPPPNTALYGVVRQIVALTTGEIRLFDDVNGARRWLVSREDS